MGTVNSKIEARRAIRKAQARANAARVERDRQNLDDVAALVMVKNRLGVIDMWEAERIDQVRAEGQRRRQTERAKAAQAIQRLRQRGESLQSIAALAGIPVREVRALNGAAAPARTAAAVTATPASGALGTDVASEPTPGTTTP